MNDTSFFTEKTIDFLQEAPEKRKILFANIPADGHFSPLTSLAVRLQQEGHDVRWYTGPSYAPKIEKLDIPYYLFDRAKEVTVHNIDEVFPERRTIKNHVKKIIFDICSYFIERGTEYFEDIKAINKSFDFDILVCDSAFTGMAFVKEKLYKHTIAIGITPLSTSAPGLPPMVMGLTPAKNWAQRALYAVLRFLTDRVLFKKPHALIDAQFKQQGMQRNGKNLFEVQIDKSTLYLQSGTPGFEYKRERLSPNVHFIGPVLPYTTHRRYDLTFKEKLNRYEHVLLVTQGTFEVDVNKLIVPAIEAFKNTDKLLVVTTAGARTEELRSRYAAWSNVVIEDFIPFSAIMPYADVFISNGGYGGVLQSITHKLPMVVGGIHEGKNEICARVGYFGLGINLRTEQPASEKLRKAVAEVLQYPRYHKNCAVLAAEFKRYQPGSLCAQFIQDLPARVK